MLSVFLLHALLFINPIGCNSFTILNNNQRDYTAYSTTTLTTLSSVLNSEISGAECQQSTSQQRRKFLSRVVGVTTVSTLSTIATSFSAGAEDDENNLTSQLYNPDGSIKEGVSTEAAARSIDTIWNIGDDRIVNVDNVSSSSGAAEGTGKQVKLSYKVPDKWTMSTSGNDNQMYLDKSENNRKACNHITIYQAPGKVTSDRLDKATSIGVGKALDVIETLSALRTGDLIGGRKEKKGDQTYYEFDLAIAPATCGQSKNNLGLGFCPYESIYLLSATIVQDRLYVIAVECDDSEWKISNADLKRLRSSFTVEAV